MQNLVGGTSLSEFRRGCHGMPKKKAVLGWQQLENRDESIEQGELARYLVQRSTAQPTP